MSRRLRVLLSAYYCSPYRGGESAVGWQVATGLAKHHDVTVICGDLSKEAPTARDLERYRSEVGLPDGLEIQHLQAGRMSRVIHDLHRMPGLWFLYYIAYRLWQKQVLRHVRQLHAAHPFDLAHHVNIIGFREPGYLWQLGIPFFWGPINGAAILPWSYLPSFGFGGAYRNFTRNVLNIIQTRINRRCRRAAKSAVKIWAVTNEDRFMVQHHWGRDAEAMIETGATPKPNIKPKTLGEGEPLKLAWCGLIEARKALHLLLPALVGVEAFRPWELHVIGTGPDESRCRVLAASLGLSARITWHGRVSHSEAQDLMASCHVLVHTALKEGTPHVVLEALSFGLPVICHDACGMGVAVDKDSGLKIPMSGPRTSVHGFHMAITRIATEEGLMGTLSAGALSRAQALSWEAKVKSLSDAYWQLAGSAAP